MNIDGIEGLWTLKREPAAVEPRCGFENT